jgi:nucleoside-diphosphate-sugar epimerase
VPGWELSGQGGSTLRGRTARRGKVLDVSRIKAMGWSVKTSLQEGLELTYRWLLENVASETLLVA